MIKVIDDWYITVESNPVCYVVRRGEGRKDEKGSHRDRAIGYYSSLRKAIYGIRKEIAARRLQSDTRTLRDACAALSELDDEFKVLVRKVTV